MVNTASQPHAQDENWDTLILGIGNVLYADEGFGVRCVERLNERFCFCDEVRVMDGGTQGIFLLPWVRSANRLLIFDAIDFNLKPASLKVIIGDDVPRYMGAKKVSMHQAGFQEVLATASLSGDLPACLALVGVQPLLLNDYGGSLTAGVKAQIDPAIEYGCSILRDWGIDVSKRSGPLDEQDIVGPSALDIDDYENGRPDLRGVSA